MPKFIKLTRACHKDTQPHEPYYDVPVYMAIDKIIAFYPYSTSRSNGESSVRFGNVPGPDGYGEEDVRETCAEILDLINAE